MAPTPSLLSSFITSLHATYGSDPGQGGYTSGQPDDRPEVRNITYN